jgi:hypothetical protein
MRDKSLPLRSHEHETHAMTPAEIELETFLNSHDDGKLLGRFQRNWSRESERKLYFFFPEVCLAIEVIGESRQSLKEMLKSIEREIRHELYNISICRLSSSAVCGDRETLIRKLRAGWISAKVNFSKNRPRAPLGAPQAAKAAPKKQPISATTSSKTRMARQTALNGGWTSIDQGVGRMGDSFKKSYATEGFGGSRDAVRIMKKELSSDSKKRNR